MRIMTNFLTADEIIRDGLPFAESRAGHGRLYVIRSGESGSRTHDRSIDLILEGDGSHNRRAPGHRAVDYSAGQYAASWESRGWLLAWIFANDPEARCGVYRNFADFNERTHGAFGTDMAQGVR